MRASEAEIERAQSDPNEAMAVSSSKRVTTNIASVSLAGVIALQLAHGVETVYRRHLQTPDTEPASSPSALYRFLHCGTGLSSDTTGKAPRQSMAI